MDLSCLHSVASIRRNNYDWNSHVTLFCLHDAPYSDELCFQSQQVDTGLSLRALAWSLHSKNEVRVKRIALGFVPECSIN